jgi:hypothetical protein
LADARGSIFLAKPFLACRQAGSALFWFEKRASGVRGFETPAIVTNAIARYKLCFVLGQKVTNTIMFKTYLYFLTKPILSAVNLGLMDIFNGNIF